MAKNDEGINLNLLPEAFYSNFLIPAKIPDICREKPCILGVDEAGRGPVLGPMVYGITFIPLCKVSDFETLGCADSKALTEKKREDLFAVLCACDDYVSWSVDIISPNFICNSMLKRAKRSLNEVAEDSTVRLIQKVLECGANIQEIYVDTVGPPEKYQVRLLKYFPQCKITVAKKADALYPIVSAASICAKVLRDRVITNWTFAENIEKNKAYGSGYPNDPATKSFLMSSIDQVFGFPNLVRFSWSTSEKILEKDALSIEWEEDDENEVSVKSYFHTSLSQNKHAAKHPFMKDNQLSNTTIF